jgi:hypothetical protein
MCTYQTEHLALRGSGKGPDGWIDLTDATVYFDHPVHARAEHTLNIDFLRPAGGPSCRVAVELEPASARLLAEAIVAALDSAPARAIVAALDPPAGHDEPPARRAGGTRRATGSTRRRGAARRPSA